MFKYFPDAPEEGGRGWNFQVLRLLSQAHHGAGHFNEMHRALKRMQVGDNESWHREWLRMAEELHGMAQEAERAGHYVTAADRYFRAFNYYRNAEFFLPRSDDRKIPTYQRCVECFQTGVALAKLPVERVYIPYEGTTLPGYFCRSQGPDLSKENGAPGVVFFGGADSIAEELYFTVPGLMRRGLNVLIVDGPGQGAALRLQGIPSRPDYDKPASAAYDWLSSQPGIDPERIAIMAMSLGGYYAPRAAAGEPRFAALVVWGPIYDYAELWAERSDHHVLADQTQWLLGASSMSEAREKMKEFTLAGHVEKIRCPTLVLAAEDDGSQLHLEHTKRLYDELTCPKQLKIFTREEGGSAHCQQDHLTLANEVIGDWLVDTLTT